MKLLTSISVLCLILQSAHDASANPPIETLLQKYCLGCHNDADRESGLSLQTPESLQKGSENGEILNSAEPRESLLYQVLAANADNAMPPPDELQPTKDERQQLRDWVIAGTRFKPMAVGKPNVPHTKPRSQAIPQILSAAVSHDERTLILGGNGQLTAKEIDSGRQLWSVAVDGKVNQVSFAKRTPWAIAAVGRPGVSGSAVFIATANGSTAKSFGGHTDAVYAATLDPSESVLATAGYDRRILLHDVKTGAILNTMQGHNGGVFSLSFAPDGNVLCSASADGTVKVWNVKTGERFDTLSQPQAEQYKVVVGTGGQHIYAAGADNRIRIWDLVSLNTTTINPLVVSRFAHEQPITSLSLSSDGTLLASAAENGTVSIWQAWPLQQIQTLPQQDKPVTSVAFVGNNQVLVGRLDGRLNSYAVKSGDPADKSPKKTAHPGSRLQLLTEMQQVVESEANNSPDEAQPVPLPATIVGVISPDGGNDRDADCFRFSAKAGQQLFLEVRAERDESPLDSKIEVLTADGKPILRTRLQAVRDSYFTFRGKDSDTVNDFRVFNWQEMELNEYLYADGEVVKLWLYPRGPDSGFMVYPGFGKRRTYFGTTPTSHALQAPCFVVVERGLTEKITPNGLPNFPIYFENDDDSQRQWGRDSRLLFTTPSDDDYVVRLTDSRNFSGEEFKYKLTIRPPKPSFTVKANTDKVKLQVGTGREIIFSATRIDGYNGPVTIDAVGLPAGFEFSGPIQIQAEQLRAFGTVFAKENATQPDAAQLKAVKFFASADGFGSQEIGGLQQLELQEEPKLRARIGNTVDEADRSNDKSVVLTIHPGETISAVVKLDRLKHDGVISFGKEDSGRNLPHGLYVDNIGLNGLLLLAGQDEREFFVTAANWVPPSTSTFYLKSNVDSITTFPVTIIVLPEKRPAEELSATQR